MKLILSIAFYILSMGVCISQLHQDENYLPPEFVYGMNELDSFMMDNFVITRDIKYYGFITTIEAEFVVQADGSISNVEIIGKAELHGAYVNPGGKEFFPELIEYYNSEFKRILEFSDGLWIPAERNDRLIDEKFSVRFIHNPGSYNSFVDLDVIRFEVDAWDHTEPKRHHAIGVKKLNQGKFFIACKYFKEAIRLDNSYVDAFYNLGIANLQLEDFEEACRAWNYAQRLGDEGVAELIEKYCEN